MKSLMRTAGLLGVCVALFGTSSSYAVSGSWNVDAPGNWSGTANWTSNPTVPGGVGDTISLTYDITENRTVTIDTTPRTAGILNIGDADASAAYTLAASGGGYLTMDNGASAAEINILSTARNTTISAPIRLAGDLKITNNPTVAAYAMTLSGSLTSSTAGLHTVTLSNSSANASVLNGPITDGTGTVRLVLDSPSGFSVGNAGNTYSGGTLIRNGGMTYNTANALGTGTVTLGDGAATTGAATLSIANDRTIANNIVVSSGLVGGGAAFLQMRDVFADVRTANFTGNMDLQGSLVLRFFGSLNDSMILAGNITGVGALNFNTTLINSNTGNNTFVLSGSNSFSGGVTTGMHRLNINSATALGTGTLTINDSLNAGGKAAEIDNGSGGSLVLTTNNAQQWQSNFTFVGTNDLDMGTGAVTFNSNRTVTVTAGTLVIGGAMDAGGSGYTFTKAGAGTLALNGVNTFSGATTVSAGTLRGNGSLAGPVYVSSGATLEAGNSIGTFTTAGEAWFDTGSTYKFELNSTNGTYDQLVASSLSLESNVTFSVDDLGTGVWTGPASFVIVENTSGTAVDGIFDGYAEGSSVNIGDNVFTISYVGGTGNDVTLTYNVIPEPGAWMLVTLGLGLTLLRRRRA